MILVGRGKKDKFMRGNCYYFIVLFYSEFEFRILYYKVKYFFFMVCFVFNGNIYKIEEVKK